MVVLESRTVYFFVFCFLQCISFCGICVMGPYMFVVFKFFDRELVLKIEDLKRDNVLS